MDETDNGRTIVRFLLSVMQGELPGFKECHRMDAARLLQEFGGVTVETSGETPVPPPTRRERRDTRRADRRIQTELAQIVKEETGNGRAIVKFLVSAMEGELADFKPHHRMSASRELLRQGSQYALVEEEAEAEPVETPEEKEERLRREDYDRRRAEAVEFSLHGPVYYETYPDAWCICENRRYDCDGNELSGEALEKRLALAPGWDTFIHDRERQADYKRRYKAYLERINPGVEIDINQFRWRTIPDDPYP